MRPATSSPANDTATATADAVTTEGNAACLIYIPTNAQMTTPVKIASR
jgi:hypothetical protein